MAPRRRVARELAAEPVAALSLRNLEPETSRIVEQSETVYFPYSPAAVMATGYLTHRNIATVQKCLDMLGVFVALPAAVEDCGEALADVDIGYDLELVRGTINLIRALAVEAVPAAGPHDAPSPRQEAAALRSGDVSRRARR